MMSPEISISVDALSLLSTTGRSSADIAVAPLLAIFKWFVLSVLLIFVWGFFYGMVLFSPELAPELRESIINRTGLALGVFIVGIFIAFVRP